MTDENSTVAQPNPPAPKWRPLSAIDRRVLGVLAEKAKTTPDIYPMSLNALVTGCNQKTNRAPLMQIEQDDAEESLDRLREIGAVGMVEGSGRVTRYRHYLYDWLGVEKIELSVMTELLLRGAQTEGELRGRASRMDPIADLAALRSLLASLMAKGLVVSITPEGRGHVVTHNLYSPREMERIKAEFAHQTFADASYQDDETPQTPVPRAAAPSVVTAASQVAMPHVASPVGATPSVEPLRREVEELRAQVAQLRHDLEEVVAGQQQMSEELRTLKDALGG